MEEKLLQFIAYAKKKGYADLNSVWEKTVDGGETCTIKQGDFTYMDTYFGGEVDAGQERVLDNGKVVWVMAYRGGSLNPGLSDEAFSFLKKCIANIPSEFPARGPRKFAEGDWEYENIWKGDIEGFTGEENIYHKGRKVCFRNYLGGLIKNKE